jgi:hypothetical protein
MRVHPAYARNGRDEVADDHAIRFRQHAPTAFRSVDKLQHFRGLRSRAAATF